MQKAIGCAILAFCGQAQASLQEVGGADYAFDSSSSLYWLSPSSTVGFSFNDVTTSAWSSTGWRHATDSEVIDLFGRYQGQYGALISGLGGPTFTYQSGGLSFVGIDAVTALAGPGSHAVASVQVATDGTNAFSYPSVSFQSDNVGQLYGGGFNLSGGVGHFMVNTAAVVAPVPEPETWAMMALGLGVIGWVARRRSAGAHRAGSHLGASCGDDGSDGKHRRMERQRT